MNVNELLNDTPPRAQRRQQIWSIACALAFLAIVAVLMWASTGFAQVVATTPAVPVVDVPVAPAAGVDWTQMLLRVLMAIGAAIGTLITTVLIPAFLSWLKSRQADSNASTGTKMLLSATLKLETFIEAALAAGWAAFQADIKAAEDPSSDGGATVTPAELAKAKTDTFDAVKKYLGANGLAQLESALGFGGDLLDTFIKGQIDKKVQAAQAAGSIAAASVTTGAQAAAALAKL